MSTTHQLRWGRLRVEREVLDMKTRRTTRHPVPIVQLIAYTKTEQARVIELTERELTELIADAATALVTIQNVRREAAAKIAKQQREVLNAALDGQP